MAVEIGLIFSQSARGVISHFNQSQGFDGVVFNVMGMFILINTFAAALLAGSAEAIAMLVNNAQYRGRGRGAQAIGLHGMQALPLLGWLVDRWRVPRPAMWVGMAAVIYTVVFLFAPRQALAGRPVL
jgi:hypothetical protein